MYWPGFLKPYKDELFSSWFIRLCYNHRVKSHTFSKFYLDGLPIWNRDIDLHPDSSLIKKLSSHTSLTRKEINDLFLDSFQGRLFLNTSNNSVFTGLTRIGIYHRKRTCFGLLYCPICLSEEPFFKKRWRLLTSLVCVKCRVLLIDRCLNCHMPVEFYRLETGSKEEILKHDLHICWKCHADLRNFIVPANDTTLIKYQSYVDSSIKYGYNKHTNYSFLYFQVLIPLASKMLSNSKNWGRIRKAAEKYFDLEITRFNNLNSLNSRRQVLPLAFQMLENWPENWLNIRETYEIRYSDFSKDLNWNVPHWFYKSFI